MTEAQTVRYMKLAIKGYRMAVSSVSPPDLQIFAPDGYMGTYINHDHIPPAEVIDDILNWLEDEANAPSPLRVFYLSATTT